MENINLPFCLCGCGERVTALKNKFLNYHYIRYNNPMKNKKVSEKVRQRNIGRKKTKEEIEKLKISCKGINRREKNGMFNIRGKDNPNYGKVLTKETKKRISESKKESIPWNKGVPCSIKTRKKISFGNTGKKRSDEFKKEKSERMKGKNHPNWRGGCTKEGYCEEWRTKDLKDHILERDEYKCQNLQCENKSNKICVHHINYNKKDCDPWNLITTCFSCNSIANYNREWWASYYQEIIRKKEIYHSLK